MEALSNCEFVDQHQHSFFAILQGLGLGFKFDPLLQTIRVEKVEVLARTGCWRFHLRFPEIMREWHVIWPQLSAALLQRIPNLHMVDYVDYYQCPNNDLGFFMEHYKEVFLAKAVSLVPSVSGWLSTVPMEIKGNHINLHLPTELGVQFILDKQIDLLLAGILKKHFGIDAFFELYVDDSLVFEQMKEVAAPAPPVLPVARQSEKKNKVGLTRPNSDKVFVGKKIKNTPLPIENILDEERNVTVQGQIIQTDARKLKSGRTLYIWDLCDGTDSISVKIFADEDSQEILAGLAKGQWLLVRGPAQYDRFSQELTIMARDINEIAPTLREDRAKQKRIELHTHTKMSALDGLVEVEDIIRTAARWSHAAVAITDHGVVQAFPDAYAAGKRYGVKIIYGVEAYLAVEKNGEPSYYHIVLLAKNQQGLENLYRLISLSHLEHFYRRPRIPREALLDLREGLLLGSACEAGELIQAYLAGAPLDELTRIADFYDYIEVMPIGNNEFLLNQDRIKSLDELQSMNRLLIELGQKLNKPVVATGDVHFLEPEDEVYRRILQAGQGYEDDRQAPLYFRTTEEMLAEFEYLSPDLARQIVIENPHFINEQIDAISPMPEGLFAPEIPGAEEEITAMCHREAHRLYGELLPGIVANRLDKELHSIISNGFAILYFIAHKLVKKSNDDGYLVGSRGSVGSSLVATFCGITEVNPLPPHYHCPHCRHSEFIVDGSFSSGADLPDQKCPRCGVALHKEGHDIPFETFLGFEGDKVPDIDLNFSGEYQPHAHRYTEEIFGKDYVFRAGTIATIAEKTAFGFVKKYLEKTESYKRNAEINRLVQGCSGVKRTTGQHPGGLMVVPKNLDIHQFTPIQRPADDVKSGTITTHFDYHSIADRLVKLDILGHDDPTMIKMLEDLTGVDAQAIPLDDADTLSLFSGVEILRVKPEIIGSSVGTFGIPEFGTGFVRQMLEATKPQKFSELVRISGFSHGTDVWLNNAQELIKSGVAQLSEAISTRDDIMLNLIYKGMPPEIAFKIMEDVRKGKGVKPEYEQLMLKHGVPDWYICSCKKIKYMFPKAHAVAYVTMAFRIAYFKINYPLAFYASYFTVRANEFDAHLISTGAEQVAQTIKNMENKGNGLSAREKSLASILEVALEMMARGFAFHQVDLAQSHATLFTIVDNGLLPPFLSLPGIGMRAAENLAAARNERPFTSIEDLKYRGKVSKTVIDALAAQGSLAGLAPTDQLSLF